MLKFYFNLSPNPMKVALFLEEAGLAYEAVPIDVRTGDQFGSVLLAVNPNGKVPAIEDDGVTVFDSNAILLYLAEKIGRFLPPPGDANRGQLLSWLMFAATGLGPYSGQAVHFKHFAPDGGDYAHQRYQFEARRHYEVLDAHLAGKRWMVGEAYTIVDMDVWGWARVLPFILGPQGWTDFPNLKRLVDEVESRPATARVLALNDRFAFKREMDAEARRHMFRHVPA